MEKERPPTEQGLAGYSGIDTWDDRRILEALIGGQERAIAAVRAAIPQLSEAAGAIAARLAAGGKLIYAGAGTSIRIAVQDGSELPVTFGMAEDKLAYIIAGGRAAIFDSLADAEDDAKGGERAADICQAGDAMIAVAASGATPYTLAAAKRGQQRGALVVGVVNNPGTPLGLLADIEIMLGSGPEVIAGSTRLAAGTAQKAALNLLSTLTHIRLGAVHDGMMVNVRAGNLKLKRRARHIVMRITGAEKQRAAAALDASHGEVKPAVLICAGARTNDAALSLLADANGNLRLALARLAAPRKD